MGRTILTQYSKEEYADMYFEMFCSVGGDYEEMLNLSDEELDSRAHTIAEAWIDFMITDSSDEVNFELALEVLYSLVDGVDARLPEYNSLEELAAELLRQALKDAHVLEVNVLRQRIKQAMNE